MQDASPTNTPPSIITLTEAKAAGLRHYFTGEPCKRGHVASRLVSGATCCECARERNARHYAENRDKLRDRNASYRAKNADRLREYNSLYRAENAEKVRAKDARYRAENRDKHREYQARWRAKNPEKLCERNSRYRAKHADKRREYNTRYRVERQEVYTAATHKRRARLLNATPAWDAELTDLVAQEAADLARMREQATGIKWHIDHMIPLQARNACGLHVWSNLQVIPATLNSYKNNRLVLTEPGEWIQTM